MNKFKCPKCQPYKWGFPVCRPNGRGKQVYCPVCHATFDEDGKEAEPEKAKKVDTVTPYQHTIYG